MNKNLYETYFIITSSGSCCSCTHDMCCKRKFCHARYLGPIKAILKMICHHLCSTKMKTNRGTFTHAHATECEMSSPASPHHQCVEAEATKRAKPPMPCACNKIARMSCSMRDVPSHRWFILFGGPK